MATRCVHGSFFQQLCHPLSAMGYMRAAAKYFLSCIRQSVPGLDLQLNSQALKGCASAASETDWCVPRSAGHLHAPQFWRHEAGTPVYHGGLTAGCLLHAHDRIAGIAQRGRHAPGRPAVAPGRSVRLDARADAAARLRLGRLAPRQLLPQPPAQGCSSMCQCTHRPCSASFRDIGLLVTCACMCQAAHSCRTAVTLLTELRYSNK